MRRKKTASGKVRPIGVEVTSVELFDALARLPEMCRRANPFLDCDLYSDNIAVAFDRLKRRKAEFVVAGVGEEPPRKLSRLAEEKLDGNRVLYWRENDYSVVTEWFKHAIASLLADNRA